MKKTFFEKGISANRNLLAIIIVGLTIIAIATISVFYFLSGESKSDTAEKIFNALLPMFSTWVGTVLAFYFGRENFEAASNRYEKLISDLSPEVLKNVSVEQIMIDLQTMVFMEYKDVKDKSISFLIDKMENSVKKTRLPILEEGKAKYIIHRSTFSDAIRKDPSIEIQFDGFISNEKIETKISSFVEVSKNSSLEEAQSKLNSQINIRDIFVVDEKQKVIGWITDTLILKYLNRNK